MSSLLVTVDELSFMTSPLSVANMIFMCMKVMGNFCGSRAPVENSS